ncbi:MAG: amidohydrolase family protein [Kiritimatiellia bacterium]|jgi:predicted TIM-barrel fold metal-dependent hydrolase|nr:amidohydrolase family protein [Kiritimatiellia bacterium]
MLAPPPRGDYNGADFMNTPCPVFDFHAHLYPDALARNVVEALARRFGNPAAFDGTVDGMTRELAVSGLCGALNLPVATRPDQVRSINDWAAANNRGPVYSLATLHPDTRDIPGTLEALRAAGFRGIKLHPEYQAFRLDDPRLAPVWETCPALGLFVFLHAGGERVFTPPFHSTPSDVAALLDRYPELTLVAAHLGGFQMWDEAEERLIGRPLYLDLSHTFFWMPDTQILRMVRRHGADRILFGSDAPWQKPAAVLAAFLNLPFREAEQRKILWENAARLLRLPTAGRPAVPLPPNPITQAAS